ncbi:hypothetical protein [Glaesserella parasuis]|uniref:hypothetical protein n=1 Tax=Glaesserella parasuis TaxID=738 RepID=UPI0013663D40|nr:hypothetical protein [Glaesserella parasuis]MDG6429581.1 hypothetical protein [Glaesserella parasuis]MDG6843444.1 hypothetical protein [Glaesserella parasuis]MDO9828035.1 hypothetical protein [Glaesserella parasuis]MDO9856633.1 hypothetical protein [Glaesserella parasuis]MDO9858941.1 hypothetical protein [Glaesserella parasuis]
MSNKINVLVIIKDHLSTLKNYNNGKISVIDVSVLLILPLIIVLLLAYYKYAINKEFVSLVVNFSSIVTSLLISVLVLIYDQYSKIRPENDTQTLKKKVLEQLFSNVSFTILMGIITVIFCLLLNIYSTNSNGSYQIPNYSISIGEYAFTIHFMEMCFTPVILFFLLQMILTLFMALKRLHIIFFAR